MLEKHWLGNRILFTALSCPGTKRTQKPWCKRPCLLLESSADLNGIIHVMLILLACRMQELLGQQGFHLDIRRRSQRPDSVPLRGHCVKLWEWGKKCNGDPRKLEKPRMWNFWRKLQGVNNANSREMSWELQPLIVIWGQGQASPLEFISFHNLP